jgi:hypothetical protein
MKLSIETPEKKQGAHEHDASALHDVRKPAEKT